MEAVISWVRGNWFSLCQSVGIIGGLFFTAISLRRDIKARRLTDFFTLKGQHQELWQEVYRRPELERIFATEVDLVSKPITTAEERFLNEATIHFFAGWLLAKQGEVSTLASLALDVKWFFNLPLPHTAWEHTKATRDPQFVKYIEKCLHRHSGRKAKF